MRRIKKRRDMKKALSSQTAPERRGRAAASDSTMPKDEQAERIRGADARCAAHRRPPLSLSVADRLTHATRPRIAGRENERRRVGERIPARRLAGDRKSTRLNSSH